MLKKITAMLLISLCTIQSFAGSNVKLPFIGERTFGFVSASLEYIITINKQGIITIDENTASSRNQVYKGKYQQYIPAVGAGLKGKYYYRFDDKQIEIVDSQKRPAYLCSKDGYTDGYSYEEDDKENHSGHKCVQDFIGYQKD